MCVFESKEADEADIKKIYPQFLHTMSASFDAKHEQ